MGIRYICDVCKKEYDAKSVPSPAGYPLPSETIWDKWATISYISPMQRQEEQQGPFFHSVGAVPEGFIVCSQACVEKALDEMKEHLQSAFESL